MARRKTALYAITMKSDRIHRVVQAPHVLGWTAEDYGVWAKKLSYAWGECFGRRSELVIFASGADLNDLRRKLEKDGMKNLGAFDNPEEVDFDDFNGIIGGKTL